MNTQVLVELIKNTDLDLKVRRYDSSIDPDMREGIDEARRLLEKLKSGVLRGYQSILLGDSWPLSTMVWILPTINAIEQQGISVVYVSPAKSITVTLENVKS